MEKTCKNRLDVRYALWKAHDYKDFYNGEPLAFSEMVVDHIIPKYLKNYSIEFQDILKKLDLPEDFELDSLYNYVPTRRVHNGKKGNKLFKVNRCLVALEIAEKKVPLVQEIIEEFNREIDITANLVSVKNLIKQDRRGIEQAINTLKDETSTFGISEYRNPDINFSTYNKSLNRVAIDAFLPTYRNLKGSCLIMFKTLAARDCLITLNHEQIIGQLFRGLHTHPKYCLRGFVAFENYQEKGIYFIQLGNVRFEIEESDLLELCLLVDEFSEAYISELKNIEKHYGTLSFYPTGNGHYKIIKVKRELWRRMLEFASNHDSYNGDSEWHIFGSSNTYITILTNSRNTQFNECLHANIYPAQVKNDFLNFYRPDDEVWITWKLTEKPFLSEDLLEYTFRKYWNAEIVFKWLTDEFIPKIIYETEELAKPLLKRKKNFNSFKESFNAKNYYEIETIKYLDSSKINSIQELCSDITKLQLFYSMYGQILMKKEHFQNLYKAVCYVLKNTKNVPWGYISGNLYHISQSNDESVIPDIEAYIDRLKDDVIGGFTIDTALRCIEVCTRDYECTLSTSNIKQIISLIEPLIEVYNREILFRRYLEE